MKKNEIDKKTKKAEKKPVPAKKSSAPKTVKYKKIPALFRKTYTSEKLEKKLYKRKSTLLYFKRNRCYRKRKHTP